MPCFDVILPVKAFRIDLNKGLSQTGQGLVHKAGEVNLLCSNCAFCLKNS